MVMVATLDLVLPVSAILHPLTMGQCISDKNACTLDTCDGLGNCIHSPININDGDSCTEDSCDAISGFITHSDKLQRQQFMHP